MLLHGVAGGIPVSAPLVAVACAADRAWATNPLVHRGSQRRPGGIHGYRHDRPRRSGVWLAVVTLVSVAWIGRSPRVAPEPGLLCSVRPALLVCRSRCGSACTTRGSAAALLT